MRAHRGALGPAPGVVEVVHGAGETGRALAAHPSVDLVCHVGAVATGREIGQACAARGVKALLELGGNDAVIVDAGVDPAWAAGEVATGAFANAGQLCVAAERVTSTATSPRPSSTRSSTGPGPWRSAR